MEALTKKAVHLMNTPTKQLKHLVDINVEALMRICNNEIIDNLNFPTKLKYAEIAPIFKRIDSILVRNYRPNSILPVVSKIFERIMGASRVYAWTTTF